MTQIKINTSMCLLPAQLPLSAWTGHIPFGAWLVEQLQPRILVELGTHNGGSYLAFCQAVKQCNLSTRCHAVDTWHGDAHAGNYGDEVFAALQGMHDDAYGAFSQLLRMTFREALAYFDDGSIDLLHIDGLHTYDAVREDFDTWLPKLSRRGVILFHDTVVREREFGVWKLWAEVREQWPSFEFHHAHGLGVLAVGDECMTDVLTLCHQGPQEEATTRRLFETLADGIEQRVRLDAAHAVARGLQNTVNERDLQIDGLRAEILGFQRQVAQLQDQRTVLETQQSSLESQREKLEAHRQQLQTTLESERSSFATVRDQLEAHRQQLQATLESERSRFSSISEDMCAQHASLEEQRAQVHAHRMELQMALVEEREERAALQTDFRRQHQSWQAESTALRQELERAMASLAQRESRVQALVAERDAMLASRSWRWTAVIRAISSRSRRLAAR